MTPDRIEPFFATLKAANPQPASELDYSSVFELLAAVLLWPSPPTSASTFHGGEIG